MKTTFLRTATLGLALSAMIFSVAGCETIKEADRQFESNHAEANVLVDRSRAPVPTHAADSIRHNEGVWLGSTSIRSSNGDPLPSALDNVTLVEAEPLTLPEFALALGELTGFMVVIESSGEGVPAVADSVESSDDSTGDVVSPMDAAAASMLGVPLDTGANGDVGATSNDDAVYFNHTGSLRDLLNYASTGYDMSWTFEDGEIRFYKYDTRVFSILAMPGTTKFAGTFVSEASQDGGGGGGSVETSTLNGKQEVTVNADFDIWDEITETVTNLLPEETQDLMSIAPAMGTVTVTAPPYAMRRIESYVSEINDRFSRQVTLNVTLLTVDVTDIDNYQISPAEFLVNNPNFDLTLNGVGIIGGDSPATLALSGVVNNESLGATLNALSSEGRITDRAQTSVTAMNGRPAPVQIVEQLAYIRERSVTSTNDTGATEVSVTPGQITTGLTMSVLPRILSDGELMLNYSLSLSRLLALDSVDSGDGGFIQLPNTEIRALMQQVMLQSGNTLVLAGFERDIIDRDDQGVGSADNWFLGGGSRGEVRRAILIIMITPQVLQDWTPRDPRGA